ncbi:helix-turn-helix domain-containing protein [Myxococcota bacterium]|nr:helix-turn-helix domain-containing protein [Myxococcota bacterium]
MDISSDAFNQIVTLQVELFKVLANSTRLGIIYTLKGGEAKYLAEIREVLDISKANLSQHLAILKNAGIIDIIPQGRHSLAVLKAKSLVDACSLVRELIKERLENSMKPFLEDQDNDA